ncbi:MAG: TetR/AcrR family transcriptional regulator [Thermoanaerobaculia bacterium]
MSGNARKQKGEAAEQPAAKPPRKLSSRTDRRVLRTRDTLGDALVELMHEKPFDDITVQEVLDRAGVVRSTFYTHYRDKNDLFLSDVEDFFEMFSTKLTRREASPQRLAPVTELFTHLAGAREFYAALKAAGKVNDVQALGRGFFARSFEERLRMAGVAMEPMELSARAHALAGSLFALMDWWIDKGMKADPKEMDDLFHRMAWSGAAGR